MRCTVWRRRCKAIGKRVRESVFCEPKKEATRPAAKNFLQQQAKFDHFIHCYNHERPHQGLNMRYPAELYAPFAAALRGLK
jgi:transposase InsO family protein